MRSIILFIISTALLLVSCSKDDDHISEKDMIVGNWKATRTLNINSNNEIIYTSEDITGCDAELTFELLQDGKFNYKTYCDGTKIKPGTYTYNENTKELVLNYDTGSPETFKVHSVTSTELWFNLGKIDTGNENEIVYHIYVLRKS